MSGGAGADRVAFRSRDFGADAIADFALGADITDFSEVDGVDGLEDLAIAETGGDTLITVGAHSIRLVSVVGLAGNEDQVFQF